MGQPDLASNSLTAHADVFADIINAIIYGGKTVLEANNLRPFYSNSTVPKDSKLKGLYRDSCMEDIRSGMRYVIWGAENQYIPDPETPFKVMGYDYTLYDRQIEEFAAQNEKSGVKIYTGRILPEQKIKPVITLVLYYGRAEIPESICSMMQIPEDETLRKYIQNYKLNLIRLRELTAEQAELFQSDFACIAKFLAKSYNKKEQLLALKENKQTLIHPRDTLFTLAAITGDKRYLEISTERKGETAMCEVADALVQMGYEQSLEELAEKDLALAEKDSALAEKDSALAEKDSALAEKDSALARQELLLAEKDAQIASLMEQLKLNRAKGS